jgi:hypothetical protein
MDNTAPRVFRGLSLSLSALGLVGCVSTYAISPAELSRLDGLGSRPVQTAEQHAPVQPITERALTDISGSAAEFNKGDLLSLRLQSSNALLVEEFKTIRIENGVLLGVNARDDVLRIPLNDVSEARVSQDRPGQTGLLFGGITTGIVLAVFGLLGAVALEYSHMPTGRPLRIKGRVHTAGVVSGSAYFADVRAQVIERATALLRSVETSGETHPEARDSSHAPG